MPSKHQHITMIHSRDDIPAFGSEEEERAFWATHEISPELWRLLPPPSGDLLAALNALPLRSHEDADGRSHGIEHELANISDVAAAPRGDRP